MLWFIVPAIPTFLSSNKDFSALNKRTCESFLKVTPGNDKINFASSYRDSFAISLLLRFTIYCFAI